jgi:hypothetical protein
LNNISQYSLVRIIEIPSTGLPAGLDKAGAIEKDNDPITGEGRRERYNRSLAIGKGG